MTAEAIFIHGFACRRVAKKAGVAVTGTPGSLFTIANGRVRLVSLMGYVSTVIGAGATQLRIDMNPTVGSDTPICAAGVVTAAPAGSLFSVAGAFATALQVVLATQGAVLDTITPVLLAPGTLDLIVAVGGTTGAVDWYATWEPVDAVATLV